MPDECETTKHRVRIIADDPIFVAPEIIKLDQRSPGAKVIVVQQDMTAGMPWKDETDAG